MTEMNVVIKVQKAVDGAQLPVYQTSGAAGMDLCSADHILIIPGTAALVSTGLMIELPEGVEAQIRSRSGLAAKNNVFVLNSPGTIDSDYRGVVKVLLFNAGTEPFAVHPGDRIAQMVVARHLRAGLVVVEALADTDRGAGGFGSTGMK